MTTLEELREAAKAAMRSPEHVVRLINAALEWADMTTTKHNARAKFMKATDEMFTKLMALDRLNGSVGIVGYDDIYRAMCRVRDVGAEAIYALEHHSKERGE